MKFHIGYKRIEGVFYWLVYKNRIKDDLMCMSANVEDCFFWVTWLSSNAENN